MSITLDSLDLASVKGRGGSTRRPRRVKLAAAEVVVERPGGQAAVRLKLDRRARRALARRRKSVRARVLVSARDGAGNVRTAARTVKVGAVRRRAQEAPLKTVRMRRDAAPAPRARGLPPARRAPARGLLLRRLLHADQGAAGGRAAPSARDHAGVPEARRAPGRGRRGDRAAQAVLRPSRRVGGVGAGLRPARGARAVRGRRDRAVGDRHDHRGRLQPVRPPGDGLPGLDGPAHAGHEERARGGGGRGRQADPVLPGPPRPLAGADR